MSPSAPTFGPEPHTKQAPNLKRDLGDLLLGQVSPTLKSEMMNDPSDLLGEPATGAAATSACRFAVTRLRIGGVPRWTDANGRANA